MDRLFKLSAIESVRPAERRLIRSHSLERKRELLSQISDQNHGAAEITEIIGRSHRFAQSYRFETSFSSPTAGLIGNDLCRLTVVGLDRLRAKIPCHLQLLLDSVDDEDGFEAEIPQYD